MGLVVADDFLSSEEIESLVREWIVPELCERFISVVEADRSDEQTDPGDPCAPSGFRSSQSTHPLQGLDGKAAAKKSAA